MPQLRAISTDSTNLYPIFQIPEFPKQKKEQQNEQHQLPDPSKIGPTLLPGLVGRTNRPGRRSPNPRRPNPPHPLVAPASSRHARRGCPHTADCRLSNQSLPDRCYLFAVRRLTDYRLLITDYRSKAPPKKGTKKWPTQSFSRKIPPSPSPPNSSASSPA